MHGGALGSDRVALTEASKLMRCDEHTVTSREICSVIVITSQVEQSLLEA